MRRRTGPDGADTVQLNRGRTAILRCTVANCRSARVWRQAHWGVALHLLCCSA